MVAMQNLKLVEPCVEFALPFRAMMYELQRENSGFVRGPIQDMAAYIQRAQDYAAGRNLPDGYVPSNEYWLVNADGDVLGGVSFRHQLTESLLRRGGHIGYYVRPSRRRRGYGRAQLGLALEKAAALGLQRVLVTCDHDNVASARIIEANGGVFENEMVNVDTGVPVRRYWIDLCSAGADRFGSGTRGAGRRTSCALGLPT